jgi:class 3 adenylate cyclase
MESARASDAERERVAKQLRDHLADGRISHDELAVRLDATYNAKTRADLDLVLRDLPVSAEQAADETRRSRREHRRRVRKGFKAHFTSWALVNGFLVGIWATTGANVHEFWPIWPMMGWGLGLAFHATFAGFHSEKHTEWHRRREEFHRQYGMPALEQFHRQARHMHDRYARDVGRIQRRYGVELSAPATPAPSVPAPAVPARKWVAVVFTDIADSTKLNEALGDEQWRRLRSRHKEILSDVFETNGGAVVGSHGDGFVGRFSTPQEAVDAAVTVQRRLEELRQAAGFAPSVRIGVHAGEALEDDGDLVGQVVNLASRVMSEAEPDEILVTEPVADVVAAKVKLEDRGLHELRGVSQPRHLLAVIWV